MEVDKKKKVTREQVEKMLVGMIFGAVVTGMISFNHIQEGLQESFSDERLLQYLAAAASGTMSLTFGIAAIRAILVLAGVIKGVITPPDEVNEQ